MVVRNTNFSIFIQLSSSVADRLFCLRASSDGTEVLPNLSQQSSLCNNPVNTKT